MTKTANKNQNEDVRLHIEKARGIIKEYLPKTYVDKVAEKLAEQKIKITNRVIMNVRHGFAERVEVINALVEVALENKKQLEKLKELTT